MSELDLTTTGLTKDQTRSTLARFNWNVSLRSVFDTLCAGTTPFFVQFALSLGIAPARMGLITSVVSAACILQIVGMTLNSKIQDKKRFVISLAVLEPMAMVVLVLLLPFLPSGLRLPALAVGVFCAAAALNMTRPITEEWIASAIPAGLRGRYIGRRGQLTTVFVLASSLAAAQAADLLAKDYADYLSLGLGIILAVGGVFGVLAILPLRGAYLPAISAASRTNFLDLFQVVRCKPFMLFVAGVIVVNLPFFLSVPYYQAYALDSLHLTQSTIAYITCSYWLIKLGMYGLMGRLVSRWGPRKILIATVPVYVLFFACYACSGLLSVWGILIAWLLAAPSDAAFHVGTQAAYFAAVPATRNRSAYFAFYNLAVLGCSMVGALTSLSLVNFYKDAHLQLGPVTLTQFPLLFATSFLLMIPCTASAFLFARPQDAASLAAAAQAEAAALAEPAAPAAGGKAR